MRFIVTSLTMLMLWQVNANTLENVSLSFWEGNWRIEDLESGQLIAAFSLQEVEGKLEGEFKVTELFCQEQNASFPSYCPIEAFSGQFGTVETFMGHFSATGPSPLFDGDEFYIQMMKTGPAEVDLLSTSVDLHRASFSKREANLIRVSD